MAAVAGIEVILGADSAPFRREMDKARRTLRRQSQRMVRQFDTVTAAARRTTLRVVALGAAATIALGATLGRSIIGTTARFQDLRDSLDAVTQGGGADAFAFIQTEAAKTQFSVEQLTGAYIQLASSGLKPNIALVRTLANISAVAKDGNLALTAAVDLFARATASGTIGLEDLNRLSDQGINVFGILKDRLGLARLEITAFAKTAGGTPKILDAIRKGIDDLYGTAAQRRLNNLTTAFSNFGDSLDRRFAQIGNQFSGQLFNAINKVIRASEQFEKTYIRIGEVIEGFIFSFNRNFERNQARLLAFIERAAQILPAAIQALSGFTDVLKTVVGVFASIPDGVLSATASLVKYGIIVSFIAVPLRLLFGVLKVGSGILFTLVAVTTGATTATTALSVAFTATDARARFLIARMDIYKTTLRRAWDVTLGFGRSLKLLAGPTGLIALFVAGLTAAAFALGVAATGSGTFTEKLDEYIKALKRANTEHGVWRASLEGIFSAYEALNNFALFSAQPQLFSLGDRPTLGAGIDNRLGPQRENQANARPGRPFPPPRPTQITFPNREIQGPPTPQLLPTRISPFRGLAELSIADVTEKLDDLGIEYDKNRITTKATTATLGELNREATAALNIQKILRNRPGISLEERQSRDAALNRFTDSITDRIDRNGFSLIPLPTEGPLQRPDRVSRSAGPQGGGSIAEAGLFRLSETGIELGLAARATAGQVRILVTSQRRLDIANAQLSTGVNLTTQEITDLRLEAIRAQGNIDGVTAALEGIAAPVDESKRTFTEFGKSFSNTLKGSFEGVLRGTESFEKAFISALRTTFIKAATDKIFDSFLTPILGQLFGSFSSSFGGLGSIFSVAGLASTSTAGPAQPGLARGGPANRGMSYMVGEEGPELFVPNRSGQVINNGLVERLLNSEGGGGQTNNFNITGNVDTATLEAINRNLPSIAGRINRFNQQSGGA